jgi:hypothetical protein
MPHCLSGSSSVALQRAVKVGGCRNKLRENTLRPAGRCVLNIFIYRKVAWRSNCEFRLPLSGQSVRWSFTKLPERLPRLGDLHIIPESDQRAAEA